jgi:N-acetyl-anhydromuramyl-L-alanine amidase AmpD
VFVLLGLTAISPNAKQRAERKAPMEYGMVTKNSEDCSLTRKEKKASLHYLLKRDKHKTTVDFFCFSD